MFEYRGVIHVHSRFSDGSGSIEEIMSAANASELDFLILTDHNTLRALEEGYEKYYNNTLLLVGCEINDKNNENHYLAVGINKAYSTRLEAKEYVRKIKTEGGVGFIAHPFEKRNSMKEHPPFPWTNWEIDDFDGIEIWNHMSEWMEGLTEENKYNYFIHPLRSIKEPNKDALRKWDDLNLLRRVTGIGGVDAHAHKVNLLGFFEVEVFPYKVLFKSIRTHLFTEKRLLKKNDRKAFQADKQMVLRALKSGRVFVSNYYVADASGFRFFAEINNKHYHMGDSIHIKNNEKIKLRVLLPNLGANIRLIRNGKPIEEVENTDAEFVVKKSGAYRVEVFLDGKAWIYSNHIRIGI